MLDAGEKGFPPARPRSNVACPTHSGEWKSRSSQVRGPFLVSRASTKRRQEGPHPQTTRSLYQKHGPVRRRRGRASAAAREMSISHFLPSPARSARKTTPSPRKQCDSHNSSQEECGCSSVPSPSISIPTPSKKKEKKRERKKKRPEGRLRSKKSNRERTKDGDTKNENQNGPEITPCYWGAKPSYNI